MKKLDPSRLIVVCSWHLSCLSHLSPPTASQATEAVVPKQQHRHS